MLVRTYTVLGDKMKQSCTAQNIEELACSMQNVADKFLLVGIIMGVAVVLSIAFCFMTTRAKSTNKRDHS